MYTNEYQIVGLYNHNVDSYNLVKSSFESGEKIVGIVHATGTGKSYNSLQLAYDYKDKKIIYVVPSKGIIEHIIKIIEDNPNLDLKRDFPNLKFRTYQSFTLLTEEEISKINCDLLILDEFHHIGAPIWGSKINTMIETHPNMKVFGMTAYTVRDRGTAYERDMANPETNEIFSKKIKSRYDLCDAMIDGILPKPIYKSAYTNLIELESKLEEKVKQIGVSTKEYQEYMKILKDVKKRIHEAPSISNIIKKNLKQDGKYIYFCPPNSEEGKNDIETIKSQAIEWLKDFINEEDIVVYTSTSDMGEIGKKNREAFYRDVDLKGKNVDNKFRIMFAINQYNEGIHAPNIDGVIMGRETISDIVYFEQLGRALSVRGDTKEKYKELEQYSIEELINICKEKNILIKDNNSKEEMIEKIIAPVVIDLANNYEYIKELENNLKDRIKEIQTRGSGTHRKIKIKDATFDIEIENQDLFETLNYVMYRLTSTWEQKYNLAKEYYKYYGNLEIPCSFKTTNGYEYDENGINLGNWIRTIRDVYNGRQNSYKLTEERIEALKKIGMRFEVKDRDKIWNAKYNLAKAYYEHHGNLNIPEAYKTKNGYEYDENGINLGSWIATNRMAYNGRQNSYKLTEERIEALKEIGMRFTTKNNEESWNAKYNLAKTYYEHHGDLKIPLKYKTKNGYEYDENGINLGPWIGTQRQNYKNNKLPEEKINKLLEIKMIFLNEPSYLQGNHMYNLAKAYYEHHGNLEVTVIFKTTNGYDYDENGENLGKWIQDQREKYNAGRLSENRYKLLLDIGMRFSATYKDDVWNKMYELAKAYYECYGDLKIGYHFETNNGIDHNKGELKLGRWISQQRYNYRTNKISRDRINRLNQIGMDWMALEISEKQMKENITSKNLKRKRTIVQNILLSSFENYDTTTLLSKEEINQGFMTELDKHVKVKTK